MCSESMTTLANTAARSNRGTKPTAAVKIAHVHAIIRAKLRFRQSLRIPSIAHSNWRSAKCYKVLLGANLLRSFPDVSFGFSNRSNTLAEMALASLTLLRGNPTSLSRFL